MDSKARFRLRKFVSELSSYRARHTELVSVYIPKDYNIIKVIQQISSEQGTARNIKSATTRKNVTDALEKMIRELRSHKRTPENGLAVFSGNVSEREGQSDVKVWSIEPPIPLKLRSYKCGQAFFLDPLKEMTAPTAAYGLIVLDRREADIAFLKGKAIIPAASFKSIVPGKIRAGGQSAARFARVREGLIKDFYKKVGDAVNKAFQDLGALKGIIVGGPGPSKEEFIKGSFLSSAVKDKIIGTIDIGYTGSDGLEELVDKSSDILAQEEITHEKQAVQRLLNLLSTKPSLVAYGKEEVERAISAGAVELLLISEDIPEEDIEAMSDKIENSGGKWSLISKETREGVQLAEIGGLAAILRFSIGT